jgi:putative transposase
MLTLVVSHRVMNVMRNLVPEESERFTPLRWAELFYTSANELMDRILALEGIYLDTFTLLMLYASEGIDPNVNRERLLTPWVKAVNSQLVNAI